MTAPAPTSLAAVPGITVGHAAVPAHGTGCTVVLGPPAGLRAAVALRGRATGTRELDALSPRHVVERVDATSSPEAPPTASAPPTA